jgi:DNA polymerase-3 subunit alpha/error-prone DNA polymerase
MIIQAKAKSRKGIEGDWPPPSGYFLITWDYPIQHQSRLSACRSRSGANSIVLLSGTAICPIELDLYFERFLNQPQEPTRFWHWLVLERTWYYSPIYFDKYAEHVAFAEPTWSLNTVPYFK